MFFFFGWFSRKLNPLTFVKIYKLINEYLVSHNKKNIDFSFLSLLSEKRKKKRATFLFTRSRVEPLTTITDPKQKYIQMCE